MTHAARTHDVIDRLQRMRDELDARIEPALCEPSCRRMEMRKGGEAWAW